jgi:type III secretion protein Q
LNNLLLSRQPTFTAALKDQSADIKLTPASRVQSMLKIRLSAPGMSYGLELDEGFAQQLLQAWGLEGTLDSLPPSLQDALLAAALAPLAQQLPIAPIARISRRRAADPEAGCAARLGLWRETPAAALPLANLELDANAADALIRLLQNTPACAAPSACSALPLAFTLSLDSVSLSASEIRELAIDDVLLLPPSNAADLIIVLKLNARPLASARLHDAQVIIEQILEQTMAADDPTPHSESAPSAIDPDALEIRLDFDLGSVSLPLGELRDLQPGYSFALDMPAGGRVRILAGSQIIGQGELVQIEQRLGVRITKLALQTDG